MEDKFDQLQKFPELETVRKNCQSYDSIPAVLFPISRMVAIPTQEQLRQRLVLTEDDIRTLYIIAAYAAGIFVLWNFPILKHLLYPFKLVVVSF